jgi:hypothetical protein
MVGEYMKKYKNISYSQNIQAVGMLPAILESIDMSNGRYTWLFGSDDFMQEDALEIVLKNIKNQSPTLILANRLNVTSIEDARAYVETQKKILSFQGFSDFAIYF